MTIDDWKKDFQLAVALTIDEWRKKHPALEVSMLALDCHPWNGFLELALLTKDEAEDDELLKDPEEMADWRFFQFSKTCAGWKASEKLAEVMKADYSQSENKKLDGEKYFQVCAEVLNSPMVMKEIGELKKTSDFRVSVANPDSGKEYI